MKNFSRIKEIPPALCLAFAVVVLPLSFLTIPIVVRADSAITSYTLLAPLPCIPSPASEDVNGNAVPAVSCPGTDATHIQTVSTVSFTDYVQYIFNVLIALAAVAAVFMITWGGFTYMTAEALPIKQDGLKKVQNAIWGLLLILCSWLILRTIDPRLVNIPPTFVPQLSLTISSGNTSGDLFAYMQSQADTYQLAQLAQQAKTTQAAVAVLQGQKSDLQNQLDSEYIASGGVDTLDTQYTQAQMADLQNQIDQQQANLVLNANQDRLQQLLQANTGTNNLGSDAAYTAALAQIQQIENTNLTKLQPLGLQSSPGSNSNWQVRDEATFAQGVLTVEKDCSDNVGSQVQGPITSHLATITPLIKNAAVRDQLNTYAQSAISSNCGTAGSIPVPAFSAPTQPATTP